MTVVLAALLSAAMFYVSQGLDNVWALAWFAPTPLLWLAYGKTRGWQLLSACAVSMLASAIYVFQCYRMLPFSVLVPAVALEAILFSIAIWFARFVHRRLTPIVTLFAFPVCWTAFEFLTSLASPNGTYGSIAYSQVSAPFLIQSASLLGMYSITFLICLFSNTVALALRMQRNTLTAVVLGLAICMANLMFNFMRLAHTSAETVRVAAMVDESAMAKAWDVHTAQEAAAISDSYAHAIRNAAAQGASFVVMPEGGIVYNASWRSTVLAPLVTVARETGAQVIAGTVERDPDVDLAFALQPDGNMYRYTKRHLVPGLETHFTPGHTSGWLGGGRAMEICKDMDFPSTIRSDAAKGARLMGVPAGDFGADAWLHARMAVMRGVEGGFALVRAANKGLVTASDAEGRLIASKMVASDGLTMIVTDLPLGSGSTLYARIGNLFPWLCTVLLLTITICLPLSKTGRRAHTAE